MMLVRLSLFVVGAAAAAALADCNLLAGSGCTAIGCIDGARVTAGSSSGSWAPGVYAFDLKVDGAPAMCTLSVPASPSGLIPDGVVGGTCDSTVASLSLLQDSSCVTMTSGAATSSSCRPIAGQLHALLTLAGTPTRAVIDVSRDGAELSSQTVSFTYEVFQPNGPNCGPGCSEASATITVAADAPGAIADGGNDETDGRVGAAPTASAEAGGDAGDDAEGDALQ
jgi:hypothetical protein